jgi:hypothetical protein
MKLTWREGKHKFRDARLAYINNIKVAAISWQASGETQFNISMLLPGLPKTGNTYKTFENAQRIVEERVETWFKLVEQS